MSPRKPVVSSYGALQGRLEKSQASESYASGSHALPGRGGPSRGLNSEWPYRRLNYDSVSDQREVIQVV